MSCRCGAINHGLGGGKVLFGGGELLLCRSPAEESMFGEVGLCGGHGVFDGGEGFVGLETLTVESDTGLAPYLSSVSITARTAVSCASNSRLSPVIAHHADSDLGADTVASNPTRPAPTASRRSFDLVAETRASPP